MNGPSVGHGSPGGSECRSQYDNGAVTPAELTGPGRRNCRGRQTAKNVFTLSLSRRSQRDSPRTLRAWLGRASRPGKNSMEVLYMRKKIDPVVDEAIETL